MGTRWRSKTIDGDTTSKTRKKRWAPITWVRPESTISTAAAPCKLNYEVGNSVAESNHEGCRWPGGCNRGRASAWAEGNKCLGPLAGARPRSTLKGRVLSRTCRDARASRAYFARFDPGVAFNS